VLACGIDAEREDFRFLADVGRSAAHQPLDRVDGALGLGEQAAARRFAGDDCAVSVHADTEGHSGVP
jgi:hypothetical protein